MSSGWCQHWPRALALMLAAWLGPAATLAQPAPDALNAVLTLSTDYMLNGLSQTDGDPSLRLVVDFEHASGFFAGGVLANVNYAAESFLASPRDTQVALYAGYVWRGGDWMSNLMVSHYLYPGIDRDYDYTQATVNLSFRERFFLTGSRSSSYLSVYGTTEQLGAGLAWPLTARFELGANTGRFRSNGTFDIAYTYWDVGISRAFDRIALDLRYHANSYPRSSLLGNEDTDLWVLSVTYAFLPSLNRGS